jgi:hypothetical protein
LYEDLLFLRHWVYIYKTVELSMIYPVSFFSLLEFMPMNVSYLVENNKKYRNDHMHLSSCVITYIHLFI